MDNPSDQITQLLRSWNQGDRVAMDQVIPHLAYIKDSRVEISLAQGCGLSVEAVEFIYLVSLS